MKHLFYFIILFLITSSLNAKEVSLLLIRHGETDWNRAGIVQGQTDIPLNTKGKEQADKTALELLEKHSNISAIYSSDLSRAYDTAKAIADKLNLSITKCPSLREINTGIAEGMTTVKKVSLFREKWDEINRQYPDRRERWNHVAVPGEETINHLIARIKEELLRICFEASDNEKIAIFSHSRAICSFVADITDKDWEKMTLPNCGSIEILYNSENLNNPFQLITVM